MAVISSRLTEKSAWPTPTMTMLRGKFEAFTSRSIVCVLLLARPGEGGGDKARATMQTQMSTQKGASPHDIHSNTSSSCFVHMKPGVKNVSNVRNVFLPCFRLDYCTVFFTSYSHLFLASTHS